MSSKGISNFIPAGGVNEITKFLLHFRMQESDKTYISRKILVPGEFTEVFTYFYAAENPGTGPVHKTLIPSFQTILVFSFGAIIAFPISGKY